MLATAVSSLCLMWALSLCPMIKAKGKNEIKESHFSIMYVMGTRHVFICVNKNYVISNSASMNVLLRKEGGELVHTASN